MDSDSTQPLHPGECDVLLLAVNDIEMKAVIEGSSRFRAGNKPAVRFGRKSYFDLGDVGGARIWLVRPEMGSVTPGGSMMTAMQAIDEVAPRAFIMVGVAFGVDPDKQPIGQILVSRQLESYGVQKVATDKETLEPRVIPRGDRATATNWLLDRFRTCAISWTNAPVDFGLILSGESLVDSHDYREQLRDRAPEAVGGEMEGSGLYSAAREVGWILVKAVCDYADGNKGTDKKQRQIVAARNAAEFVFATLEMGGFRIRLGRATVSAAEKKGQEPAREASPGIPVRVRPAPEAEGSSNPSSLVATSSPWQTETAVRLAISCEVSDSNFGIELTQHLAVPRRQGKVEVWRTGDVDLGAEREEYIRTGLREADIILLFYSRAYLDSDFHYEVEMTTSIEEREAGRATVIPVLVRPVDHSSRPLAQIQGLPRNNVPIEKWRSRDDAWVEVVQALGKHLEQQGSRQRKESPPRKTSHSNAKTSQAPSFRDSRREPTSSAVSPSLSSRNMRGGISPFSPGQPIQTDGGFFGRSSQRDALLQGLERGIAYQILGERRMGKTSLLKWVARHAPATLPVACLDAGDLWSPEHLVMAAAEQLGRSEEIRRQLAESGEATPSRRAAEGLKALAPAAILLDEAENMARDRHAFDAEFFGVWRTLIQDRRLLWVSASRQDLHKLFQETGLTSPFLNDARKLWVGQLAPDASTTLLSQGRLPPHQADLILELVAGFPLGLQMAGELLWEGRELNQAFEDALYASLEGHFLDWWAGRTKEERCWLKRCVAPQPSTEMPRRIRRRLLELEYRGLLAECRDAFVLPGRLWREHVEDI